MADMGIKELKPSIHGNLGSWGHAALASLVTSSHGSGLRKLLQVPPDKMDLVVYAFPNLPQTCSYMRPTKSPLSDALVQWH